MKILLLEDDKSLGPWLKKNLTEMGNSVDLFINGDKALIASLKINYEIMIIDRMVPGLDGLTLIKKIRDNGINTPVIFLTALFADLNNPITLNFTCFSYFRQSLIFVAVPKGIDSTVT